MTDNCEFALASLAVDYWKLLRSFEKLVSELPDEQSARLRAQSRFSASRLASHLELSGLQLVTFEGQHISPSMPVTAVNAEDVSGLEMIIVESTIEPAVVAGSRVILSGRVIAAICEDE